MMRRIAVLDTNVLISALLSVRGSLFRCVALAKLGAFQSVTCQQILDEFEDTLRAKLGFPPMQAQAAVAEVQGLSEVVRIPLDLKGITGDPGDDKVLECAIVGGATHVVTGDRRHLLPIGSYQGIDIVTPAAFLALVVSR